MNYRKHYDLLIERAKTRQLDGHVERHHIVPRCLGGSDDKANLVELTPEEHYVAHQLLVKIYPNNSKLIYALNMMTMGRNSSKRYGWIRRKHRSICKARIGEKNPSFGKKWYYCPITLQSGKFEKSKVPDGWVKGRILNVENFCKKQKLLEEKKEKKSERKKFAEKLFKKFVQENYRSIQQFIDDGHYEYSNESLRMLWKENVPEYFKNSSQGKPYNTGG